MSESNGNGRLHEIASRMESAQRLTEQLISEVRELYGYNQSLRADLKKLYKNVESLNNIIKGSEGKGSSVLADIEVLKTNISNISLSIDELKEQMRNMEMDKSEGERANREITDKKLMNHGLEIRKFITVIASTVLTAAAITVSIISIFY